MTDRQRPSAVFANGILRREVKLMSHRTTFALAALVVSAFAHADKLYSGTFEISGQAAGTVTLRVRENGVVTGALVGNTGNRVRGHLQGTFEGKRFKITIRLRNRSGQQFQGNFTHNDEEAHMDGLQYRRNKPIDNVRLTLNAIAMR